MMITAKCSHRYCAECAKFLFLKTIKDQGLYPPRCCKQPIPVALVAKHMRPDELAAFQLAAVEHETPNPLVQLRSGCNHMTCVHRHLFPHTRQSLTPHSCPCSAQFCYVCGAAWKTCACPAVDINRIEERAEEIVERDAPPDLLPHQRRQLVGEVFAELQNQHECEHSRRFQRIDFGKQRRGFRCEMCDARHHRYILQCRLCYVNVCEECRRNHI